MKDRLVRTKALGLVDSILQGLPEDADISEALHAALLAAVCRRALDKTVGVRLAAVRTLSRLQGDVSDGAEGTGASGDGSGAAGHPNIDPAHACLLWSVAHDPHKDVRLAALQSLAVPVQPAGTSAAEEGGEGLSAPPPPPALSPALAVLLQATRDACASVRAGAYAKIGSAVPLAQLPVPTRLLLCSTGLTDPESAVRSAATLAFAAWLWQCGYDVAALLEALGVGAAPASDVPSLGGSADMATSGSGGGSNSWRSERVAEALLWSLFAWVEGPRPAAGGSDSAGATSQAQPRSRAAAARAAAAASAADEAGEGEADDGTQGSEEGAVEGEDEDDASAAGRPRTGAASVAASAADANAAAASVLQSALSLSPARLWERCRQAVGATHPSIAEVTVAGALYWRVRAAWLAGYAGLGAAPAPTAQAPAAAPAPSKGKLGAAATAPAPAQPQLQRSRVSAAARAEQLDALLPPPGPWAEMLSSVAFEAGMTLELDAFAAAAAGGDAAASNSGGDGAAGRQRGASGGGDALSLRRLLACLPSPASLAQAQQQPLPPSPDPSTLDMLRQWLLLGQLVDFSDEAGRGKALSALLQMLPHPHLPSCPTARPETADGPGAAAADAAARGDLLPLLCRVLAVVLGCGRPAEAVGASPQFKPPHAAASSAEASGAVHAAAYSQYCALLGAAAGTLRLAAAALTGEGAGGADAGAAEGAHLAALREREALLRGDVEALRQQLEEAEEEADTSGADGSAAIADLAAALAAAEDELQRVCGEVEAEAEATHSSAALPSASAGLAAAGAGLAEGPDALSAALGQRYAQRALGIVAAAAGGEGVRVSFPLHQCLALPAMQSGLAAALAAFDVSPALAAACGLFVLESPAQAAAGGIADGGEGASSASSTGPGAVAARSPRPRQLSWLASLVMPALWGAAGGPAGDGAVAAALPAVRALSLLALSQPCPEHAADVYEAALALVAPLALGAFTSGDADAAAGAAELQLAALALLSDALQAIPRSCLAAPSEEAEGCDDVAADEAVAEWLSIRAAEGAAAAGPAPSALALRHIPLLLLEALKIHTAGAAAGAAGAVAWVAAWGLTQAVLTGRLSLLAEEAADTAAAAARPSREAVAALPLMFAVLYRQIAAETAVADSVGPTTPLPGQPASPADGAPAGSGARLSAALHVIAGASSQHAALLLHAAAQATCTLATAAAAPEVAVPAAAARAKGKRAAAAKGAASAAGAGGSRAAALLQAASTAHAASAASAAASASAAARPKRAAAVAGRAEVAAMVASESDGHGGDESGSSDDEVVPAAGAARVNGARKSARGIRGSSGDDSDGSDVSEAGRSSGSGEDEDAGFSRKRKGHSKKGKPKSQAAPKAGAKARAAKKAPAARVSTAAGAGKKSTVPPAAPGGSGDADAAALSSIPLPPAQAADPLRVALCVLLSLAQAACGSPQLPPLAPAAAPAVDGHWGWVAANPALAPALAGSQMLAVALAAADGGSAGVVGAVLSLLGDEEGPMALLTGSLAAAAAAAAEAACLPGDPGAAEASSRPACAAGALQMLLGAAAEVGGLTAAQRKAALGMQAFASDRWALAAAAAAADLEGQVGAGSGATLAAAAGGLSLAAALVGAATSVVA